MAKHLIGAIKLIQREATFWFSHVWTATVLAGTSNSPIGESNWISITFVLTTFVLTTFDHLFSFHRIAHWPTISAHKLSKAIWSPFLAYGYRDTISELFWFKSSCKWQVLVTVRFMQNGHCPLDSILNKYSTILVNFIWIRQIDYHWFGSFKRLLINLFSKSFHVSLRLENQSCLNRLNWRIRSSYLSKIQSNGH